ncbi:hypothetical protein HPB49_007774 [Dermacentor silvarum]|uniref:Uncharacterized protein n=1 Tax=Dermacentor silvarum TaxID=543639 RepID=A0ACB8D3C3_DERSI|nr:hypothetical protein HPB49_007774 [Dermacentor silvarum]
MQLKVILVGLAIFGLIVAESNAMPASSSSEAEARADPETAERAEQSNAEEARVGTKCIETLCGDDGDMGDVELPGYYLIFHTCLMVLLKLCRTCLSTACTVKLRRSGTCIIAKVECPGMHTYTWSSQHLVGDRPKGNIDLATVLLFSGSSVASSLRMMCLMGVKVIGEQCFFNYQKAYLLPAVNMVWDEHQREVMASLEGSIQLCGDGRCDSPGHSAKFWTYTFLCLDAKKIEQVQVRETWWWLHGVVFSTTQSTSTKVTVTFSPGAFTDLLAVSHGSEQGLTNQVLSLCTMYQSFREALKQAPVKAPPAYAPPAEERPSKSELVAAHKARFAKH